jgi:hypothetical protein
MVDSIFTHKIVNGERVDLTPSEIEALEELKAKIEADEAAYVPEVPPTKEELMAQLSALSAKIQMLE